MKTKDGKTKVYITENGHTRTVDISEISDVPVKGARDITEEYYNAHKEVFEKLGYESSPSYTYYRVYEMARQIMREQGYDFIAVFRDNLPIIDLIKKVNPFNPFCKIWIPKKR